MSRRLAINQTLTHTLIVLSVISVMLVGLLLGRVTFFPSSSALAYEPADLQLPAPPSPQPVPEINGPFAETEIADRRIVANIIEIALEEYFAQHGKYPAFLFGGGPAIYPNLGPYGRPFDYPFEGVGNPDPLIASGLLDSYPLIWPQPAAYYSGSRDGDVSDSRLTGHWRCLYSTPGDHLVLGEPGPLLYAAIETASREHRADVRNAWEQLDRPDFAVVRHYALGGRIKRDGNGEVQALYTAWPGDDCQRIGKLYQLYEPVRHCKSLPYFGYQRGEWFGSGPGEAWLWFYGSNVWPERNYPLPSQPFYGESPGDQWRSQYYELFSRFSATAEYPLLGLDLLNASTGELTPDGIPDGICLLYKLKDGKVVEVVRAEGI